MFFSLLLQGPIEDVSEKSFMMDISKPMGIGMRPDATVDNVKEGGQGDAGEVTPGCQVLPNI